MYRTARAKYTRGVQKGIAEILAFTAVLALEGVGASAV
jgi:phage shock protein PspC (stress-responsive transcriptional regulator)